MKYGINILHLMVLISCISTIIADNYDQHYHLYLWGYYNQLQTNFSVAEECYNKIFNSSGSIYAYTGYLDLLFATKRYNSIAQLMPRLEHHINTIPTQLIFIKTLENIGNQEEADKKMIALSAQGKQNTEIIYNTALAQVRMNDPLKAIATIDEYLQNVPEKMETFIFYFLKAQIYMRIYRQNDAAVMVKKCLELNPLFQEGWLFSGIIHELQGNIDQAIRGYQKFLTFVQHDQAVEQQLMLLLMKQQQQSIHATETNAFEHAINLYKEKKYADALTTIDTYLKKNPIDVQARLFKIELLCTLSQSSNALNLLKQWINNDQKNEVWFRTLHLLYLAGVNQDKIIELLQEIEKNKSDSIMPLLYLADIYLKKHDTQKSQEYLIKGLSLTDNGMLKAKIAYQLMIIYLEQKNSDALKEVIAKHEHYAKDFPPLLNLLAYYYATKGHNVPKAQKYIQQALVDNAENVHFLDTQALILYKENNYQKAKTLLTTLLDQAPDDFFIIYHLSKTHYKMGDTAQAIDLMAKAYSKAPSYKKNTCEALLKQWKQRSS